MKNYGNIVLMVFIYFVGFSLLITLIGFLLTRKFNKKFHKVYILFMGLSFKEVFLLSTVFLNAILIIYFLVNVNYFLPLGLYMIVVSNFLSCFFSFNFRVIIVDIIYTLISCGLLWLLLMVRNYQDYIGNIKYLNILIIVFIIMIVIYTLFITIRKINLLINIHRKVDVVLENVEGGKK